MLAVATRATTDRRQRHDADTVMQMGRKLARDIAALESRG